MIEVETIRFKDLETGGNALAVIRCDPQKVWLCLTSELNGDIEVACDRLTTQTLLDALKRAVESE